MKSFSRIRQQKNKRGKRKNGRKEMVRNRNKRLDETKELVRKRFCIELMPLQLANGRLERQKLEKVTEKVA